MFVGADDGSIFYFENTAAAGISSTSKTIRIFIRRTGDLNPITTQPNNISYSGKKAAPVLGDFDGDGDLDMFVALNEVGVPSDACSSLELSLEEDSPHNKQLKLAVFQPGGDEPLAAVARRQAEFHKKTIVHGMASG